MKDCPICKNKILALIYPLNPTSNFEIDKNGIQISNCPICFQSYQHSAILPCAHELCLNCTVNIIHGSELSKDSLEFRNIIKEYGSLCKERANHLIKNYCNYTEAIIDTPTQSNSVQNYRTFDESMTYFSLFTENGLLIINQNNILHNSNYWFYMSRELIKILRHKTHYLGHVNRGLGNDTKFCLLKNVINYLIILNNENDQDFRDWNVVINTLKRFCRDSNRYNLNYLILCIIKKIVINDQTRFEIMPASFSNIEPYEYHIGGKKSQRYI